jgi:hypothetical protein
MKEEKTALFVTNACPGCDAAKCRGVLLVMIDASITEILHPDTGETVLAPVVHFPLDVAQQLVDELRKHAAKIGVEIR